MGGCLLSIDHVMRKLRRVLDCQIVIDLVLDRIIQDLDILHCVVIGQPVKSILGNGSKVSVECRHASLGLRHRGQLCRKYYAQGCSDRSLVHTG